ncbi:hypothetical protein AC249_AIPGENE25139 [Exaiptasia diaphana]|nr:hypothetical protein AC249_AIPGENE25139 [Exaiptasia diaphana]
MQIWENYEISSQLKDHPKERRTATLLTCFQPSALQVYNSLSFASEQDKSDIDKVLEKMSEFCNGVVNETYERYLFNTRCQEPNESIDDFYGALLALSKNCSFDKLTASLIRDRLIVGMKDASSRQRLLQEKALSLEKCLEIARSFEATKARLRDMQGKSEANSSVNRVKQHPKQIPKEGKKHNSSKSSGQAKESKKCYFCGF